MIKKLFALKNGLHPGIYENWLDFYEQIKDMDVVESQIFTYDSSMIFESATTENSLEWALRRARIYLGLEQPEQESNRKMEKLSHNSEDVLEIERDKKLRDFFVCQSCMAISGLILFWRCAFLTIKTVYDIQRDIILPKSISFS